ncbi:structural protein [Vallitalea maricola]|uniref:hypothetical protein n=1 Tax=Vallitalea maricola TaxID=3074433 RepID=UPI0030DB2FA3
MKKHAFKDPMAESNFPPMHPDCRLTITMIFLTSCMTKGLQGTKTDSLDWFQKRIVPNLFKIEC